MTRTQFSELCVAIMKVVSLSSIAVIIPAYVSLDKESTDSRSSSSTVSSTERYSQHVTGASIACVYLLAVRLLHKQLKSA